MPGWEVIDRAPTPEGGELVLYGRDDEHMIRVDGLELMSTRAHHSEEEFARLALEGVRPEARILIGGLGLGYTVRAARRALGAEAEIVVAELVGALVEWHRGPLSRLGALDDPRVRPVVADVADLIAGAFGQYEAILLDVDNGPVAITRAANAAMYGAGGLAAAHRALAPEGVLAVWSAGPDQAFLGRLVAAGFDARAHRVSARGWSDDPEHTLYVARR
ncbi:MAG: hypothetical protein IT384_16700 [Deltaproteobacteria bacterium]|nr:hypothetical protein [Deltaproteobacteria bacterium]